ncbi:hypothetical protein HY641_03065 [Candidatus Woesearchaeota archaeon]|nr:hypothetical protein [Candidatus Woesearchaeota archaeon]
MALDIRPEPSPTRRCPQCKQLALIFDDERKAFRCTRCGYTQSLRAQE